jgi:hypothetical protein
MSVNDQSSSAVLKVDRDYMPAFRYAFGITLIMGYAMAFGGDLSYIVPFLSLNFLAPGTKMPSLSKGAGFVFIVAVTSIAGFLFTSFFYNYTWVYIPLLGLILFYMFYTTRLSFVTKLFMLIALLAFPVPSSGLDPVTWAYAITNTLVAGSIFSILVVWFVYSLFPDKQAIKTKGGDSAAPTKHIMDSRERFNNALNIFIITFPVVLLFIFFQWGDALLVLIYIVVLSTLQEASHNAGKAIIIGNLIGGLATIIFYELIIIAPNYLFFLLLLLGTALFFAGKIFSGKPESSLYKTGFSALVLIIGGVSTGTDAAGSEISKRIVQVMIAVLYVVVVLFVTKTFKAVKRKNESTAKAGY